MDHLVAARQSVGSGRSVRHVTRYDLPAFLVLALVLAHDHHPYCPPAPLSPSSSPFSYLPCILSSRSRRTSVISQRDPTPRGALTSRSFAFASLLTTFARREQRRTSRRHSDLSSLPGRGHDYDLLTWTTVSESGHRGVRRRISAFPRSQIEGMEAAKSRDSSSRWPSRPAATRGMCLSHSQSRKRGTRVGIKIFRSSLRCVAANA